MARKQKSLDLSSLAAISEDLRFPSLLGERPRLEGFAYRFTIVLPLLSETGAVVFSDHHLRILVELMDRRFGGCLASSHSANPAWFGSYLPAAAASPVKDYHTLFVAYTKQIDAADRFFQLLKNILKRAGSQDEIVIERVPVWLVGAANA